jgi:hypothetical protein
LVETHPKGGGEASGYEARVERIGGLGIEVTAQHDGHVSPESSSLFRPPRSANRRADAKKNNNKK